MCVCVMCVCVRVCDTTHLSLCEQLLGLGLGGECESVEERGGELARRELDEQRLRRVRLGELEPPRQRLVPRPPEGGTGYVMVHGVSGYIRVQAVRVQDMSWESVLACLGELNRPVSALCRVRLNRVQGMSGCKVCQGTG